MLLASLLASLVATSASAAPAGPEAREVLVEEIAAEPVSPARAGGPVSLLGVELAAPAKHRSFATSDALIAVIEEGQSSAVEFGLPAGAEAEVQEDGTVALTEDLGEGLMRKSAVAKPWAKDANGESLATSYSIRGGKLVQSVDVRGAEFPVIADPRITAGLGLYLNAYGYEVRAIGIAAIAAGGISLYGCDKLGKLPGAAGTVARLLCGSIGSATIVRTVLNGIITLYKSRALGTWTCYQKRIVPNVGGWYTVKASGNCTS